MELLGKSLEDTFQERNCEFSLKTTCMLGIQMIDRIEVVHNKHVIHRDIKPDNFVMGYGVSPLVYIIDFGLAKKYRSSRTYQHIKFVENKKLTGTARYASINALRGTEQSRRDDIEAIGYVIMYFLRKGKLPWQGLKIDKKEDRYKKIWEKKKNTKPEDLCAGFPPQFCEYVNYARSLEFTREPDYDYLRGLFKTVLDSINEENDGVFDWMEADATRTKGTTKELKVLETNNSNEAIDNNEEGGIEPGKYMNTEEVKKTTEIKYDKKVVETDNNQTKKKTEKLGFNVGKRTMFVSFSKIVLRGEVLGIGDWG